MTGDDYGKRRRTEGSSPLDRSKRKTQQENELRDLRSLTHPFKNIDINQLNATVHTEPEGQKTQYKAAPSVNFWAGRGWRGSEQEFDNLFGYSPDTLSYFDRMVRVCTDDLERLFISNTQHIFDMDAPNAPRDVRGADCVKAGSNMTKYFSSLLTGVLADFAKFASAMLRSDMSKGPPLDRNRIVTELEKHSKSNKDLAEQYSRLLNKFNRARRAWLKEQYEWKERFSRCECRAKDLANDVTYYEDAMWSDEGKIHKFYQEKLKALETEIGGQVAKLTRTNAELSSEVREKNEEIEYLRGMMDELKRRDREGPKKEPTNEAEVQTTSVEFDFQSCQVPRDLHEITDETLCMFHEICAECGFGAHKEEIIQARRTIAMQDSVLVGDRLLRRSDILWHIERVDSDISSDAPRGNVLSIDSESGECRVYFDEPDARARAVQVSKLNMRETADGCRKLATLPGGVGLQEAPSTIEDLLVLLPSLSSSTVAAAGFDIVGGEWEFDRERIQLVTKKNFKDAIPSMKQLVDANHPLLQGEKIQDALADMQPNTGIVLMEGFDEDVLFGIDTRYLSKSSEVFITGLNGELVPRDIPPATEYRTHGVQTVPVDKDVVVQQVEVKRQVHPGRVACEALHIQPVEKEVVVQQVETGLSSSELDVLATALGTLRTQLEKTVLPPVTKPIWEPKVVEKEVKQQEDVPSFDFTLPGSAGNSPARGAHRQADILMSEASAQTDGPYEVTQRRGRSPGRSPVTSASPRHPNCGGFRQLPSSPGAAAGSILHALSRWRMGALPALVNNGYQMMEPLNYSELALALTDADLPCSEADLRVLFAVGQGGKPQSSLTVTLKSLFDRLHLILFGNREQKMRNEDSPRSGESHSRLSTVEIAFRNRMARGRVDGKMDRELSPPNPETVGRKAYGGGFRAPDRDSSPDSSRSPGPHSRVQHAWEDESSSRPDSYRRRHPSPPARSLERVCEIYTYGESPSPREATDIDNDPSSPQKSQSAANLVSLEVPESMNLLITEEKSGREHKLGRESGPTTVSSSRVHSTSRPLSGRASRPRSATARGSSGSLSTTQSSRPTSATLSRNPSGAAMSSSQPSRSSPGMAAQASRPMSATLTRNPSGAAASTAQPSRSSPGMAAQASRPMSATLSRNPSGAAMSSSQPSRSSPGMAAQASRPMSATLTRNPSGAAAATTQPSRSSPGMAAQASRPMSATLTRNPSGACVPGPMIVSGTGQSGASSQSRPASAIATFDRYPVRTTEKALLADIVMGEADAAKWVSSDFPRPKNTRELKGTTYLPRSMARSSSSTTIKHGKP